MSKYHEKILKLSEIMGVSPNSIILEPDDFDIEETYDDELGVHHYRIKLKTGETVVEKSKSK